MEKTWKGFIPDGKAAWFRNCRDCWKSRTLFFQKHFFANWKIDCPCKCCIMETMTMNRKALPKCKGWWTITVFPDAVTATGKYIWPTQARLNATGWKPFWDILLSENKYIVHLSFLLHNKMIRRSKRIDLENSYLRRWKNEIEI